VFQQARTATAGKLLLIQGLGAASERTRCQLEHSSMRFQPKMFQAIAWLQLNSGSVFRLDQELAQLGEKVIEREKILLVQVKKSRRESVGDSVT